MESNEKEKRRYRGSWFLILILFLIMLFLSRPAEPLTTGSVPWLLTVFAFFVSLAGGIWLGLRRGQATRRSKRAKTRALRPIMRKNIFN